MPVDDSERVEPTCPACDDTGWQTKSCIGTHDAICGRRRRHQAHSFVVECQCRPMNRTYQERLESQRRVA